LRTIGPQVWGLSWLSKNQDIGAAKSLHLSQLAPLWAQTNAQWLDLQYGDTTIERQSFAQKTAHVLHKVEEVDNFFDLEGLSALIVACQGVVTTSNSTAHLAGALNQRSALLVPFGKGKLWYWHSLNGRSLWYPSIHIFEQAADGSWEQAIAQAASFVQGAS
jgi:ADP-heptose:LPS heptosyltransferase